MQKYNKFHYLQLFFILFSIFSTKTVIPSRSMPIV